ncbi:MAG: DNA polymerase-3 subunit chi, partial [Candidatus Paceibacteria bacterium]
MAEVLFYHLTRTPLEVTLPDLLTKSRARGWNVVVRAGSAERLDWLDQRLWLGADTSFLAHG